MAASRKLSGFVETVAVCDALACVARAVLTTVSARAWYQSNAEQSLPDLLMLADMVSAAAIVAFGLLANSLLLLAKPLAVRWGWCAQLGVGVSVAAMLVLAWEQVTAAGTQGVHLALIVGATVSVALRLAWAGLYSMALVRAGRELAAADRPAK